MFSFLQPYRTIEKQILLVIIAEFFIQLVNATFMNMLPLYLNTLHYSKQEIAGFISFRFLGVFLLALPLGVFIKGKKVKPFFYTSCIGVPFFALCIIYFTEQANIPMIYVSQLLWGASFTFIQIPILPFILRLSSQQNQTPSIALSYSTWSFAGIVSGIVIALLDYLNPDLFNERMVLIIFSILGFMGILMLLLANINEGDFNADTEIKKEKTNYSLAQYDWGVIIKALIPTLIIAVGAGLTIPFISLFFQEVHGMDKGSFSVVSSIAAFLVAWGALLVPNIKRNVGYKIAVPATQSLAIVSLVALATTQYYSYVSISVVIAIVCYLLRQPLMNMAGPMTTEIVMNYVGEKNQEIVSALTSAIWSGSWFVSGLLVQILFGQGFSFVNIFLLTALLYSVGVIWYMLLIRDYERKIKV
ncbi:MAG TPA: MFS transporter [Bacteroidia bacterium]|nr:MFS transporter [Bacteroidia bacterium]